MNTEKKTFDPTVCFSFFGSWVKAIEALETEQDRSSKAYLLFRAIANYSMYNETPNFQNEPMLNVAWPLIEQEIDASMNRRKRGFANDEMSEKKEKVINAIVSNPTASLRDLADITGIPKSTIDRVKRKYQKEIEEAIVKNSSNSGNASGNVCNADNSFANSIDTDINTGTDSVRRDSGTPEAIRRAYPLEKSDEEDNVKLPF